MSNEEKQPEQVEAEQMPQEHDNEKAQPPAKTPNAYEKMAGQLQYQKAETIAVIHQTVAKGTTPAELIYFLNVAKASDLNPFQKEIWCYKDHRGNLIIMTGRDGFLTIAKRSSNYKGFRSGTVCENDEFHMEQGSAGVEVKHVIHPSTKGRGAILGAWCIAFTTNGVEYFDWVDFQDYNKGKFTWETHPKDMIKKCAESHALKKAYGITGLAAAEDFDVKDGIAYPVESTNKTPLNK